MNIHSRWLVEFFLAFVVWGGLGAQVSSSIPCSEQTLPAGPAWENGADPLWGPGMVRLVRRGPVVWASISQRDPSRPPFCDAIWSLWRQAGREPWKPVVSAPAGWWEREPSPIALWKGGLLISGNPSTSEPGAHYGTCAPTLIPADAAGHLGQPVRLDFPAPFRAADHSYRGLGVDGKHALVLHQDSGNGHLYWHWLDTNLRVLAAGTLVFPNRATYPIIVLKGKEAWVLAVEDMLEPQAAWHQAKTGGAPGAWDYVFRRLYLVHAEDLHHGFGAPEVLADVNATGGSLEALDLAMESDGTLDVLYKSQVTDGRLIKPFFPKSSSAYRLEWQRWRHGQRLETRTVVGDPGALVPGQGLWGRIHKIPTGGLVLIAAIGNPGASRLWALPLTARGTPHQLDIHSSMSTFFNSSSRGGRRAGLWIFLGQGFNQTS